MPDAGTGGSPADPPVVAAPVATPDPAPVEPDFSFIPQDYHVDGKPDLGKFAEHYRTMAEGEAKRREALGLVPEGDYDFNVPADLKFDGLDLPEGFTVQAALDDPDFKALYGDLGATLKEIGAPGAVSGKIASLVAKYEAIKYSRAYAATKADFAKLGAPEQAKARADAVSRRLEALLPADQVEAIKGMTGSAKALQALEKILGPQALSAPNASPGGPSLEGLSAYERLKIANQNMPKRA